jgi:hypothetical protein
MIEQGKAPKLSALCLHNGTVYRWNRPCYGVFQGKPHLRIENRVLPSGPTVIDEMANAAFFFGLMSGVLEEYGPVEELLDFASVKSNFIAAARYGLNAEFDWFHNENIGARKLISERLLPLAREGLKSTGIDSDDIDRYLNVIEARVSKGRTGSNWALHSLAALKKQGGSQEENMRTLVKVTVDRQYGGRPVHTWKLASDQEGHRWQDSYKIVEQFMDRELFIVCEEDIVDLAATLMEWRDLKYIPVEDDSGRLVGIVTPHDLLHLLSRQFEQG